jgi:hypothetical protein
MPKATLIDKNETQTLIKHFLDEFQNCINQNRNPNQCGLDKILGSKFHITSNGEKVANNLTDYLHRIEAFQKRFTHCNIHLSAEDTVCGDNHFACYYTVDLTEKNGEKIELCMMACGACDHDKIISWKQVVNEKGKSHWEVK